MVLFDVKYKFNNIFFTIYCIKLQKFQILNVLLKNRMDEWTGMDDLKKERRMDRGIDVK